jgi:hypothetical protein
VEVVLLTAEAWQDISADECNQYATAINSTESSLLCGHAQVLSVKFRSLMLSTVVYWLLTIVAVERPTRSGTNLVGFLNRAVRRL